MIVVLDASAAVRVVTAQDTDGALAAGLVAASGVLAPDLYAAEVSNALWKLARHAGVPADTVLMSLRAALDLPDRWLSCADMAPEVLELAVQRGRPAYELYYLIAARRHGAVLLTRDAGLARLAGELGIRAG